MGNFRTGILSTFDPVLQTLDQFAIKQPYTVNDPNSLELAEHINHYFDACIKLENGLSVYNGSNLVSYDDAGNKVSSSEVLFSQTIVPVTLTSKEQNFTLTVPVQFGATPFDSTTFALMTRADERPVSSLGGVYENATPDTASSWNTMIQRQAYQCTVVPISGNVFNVRVNTFGSLISAGNGDSYAETYANISTSWSNHLGKLTPTALGEAFNYMDPSVYQVDYWKSTEEGTANYESTGVLFRPFFACLPTSRTWGGYNYDTRPQPSQRIFGLSSTFNGAGYGGTGKLYTAFIGTNADQSIEFRYSGFISDDSFFGVPFGAYGFLLRCTLNYGWTTGYGLLFGDSRGSHTNLGDSNLETAPKTAYIVRFNDCSLIPNNNVLVTDMINPGGVLPQVSTKIPKCTFVAGPVTINNSTNVADYNYKFSAVGNVISLQASVSGAAWSSILSYTDGTTGQISSGEPGVFGIAKRGGTDTSVNRWGLFSDVKFNSGNVFNSTNINLNTTFLKSGSSSSRVLQKTVASVVVSPITEFKWKDNVYVPGRSIGLQWGLGNGSIFTNSEGITLQLDWDPQGYHKLIYTMLMRLPTAVDLSDNTKKLVMKQSILNTAGDAFMNSDVTDGKYKFEIGMSTSASAVSVDTSLTLDMSKIGSVFISSGSNILRFSNGDKMADLVFPLSLIPAAYRQSVRTIYVRGEIKARGLEGVVLSNIKIV